MNTHTKQITLNFLSNIGVFLINILVNLSMTPFYIHHLGVGGFGVVQIALLLPVYINLSTLIISGAVSRFLTIALHEQNHNNANQIFNTSLFGIALILTFAMPIIIYFAININMYINIPLQYTQDSIYLFLGIFFSSTLTIFSTLFLIPAYANNRLDIQNYIKITTLFIQTGLVFFTFLIIASNLSYIGYAYTIAAFLGLFFSISIWKEFAPFLKISKSFIKFSKFQEIASMGSWLLINQMGSILFLSIDLILINHFFGPDATGKYSIVLQWSVLLRSMASMIASVLDPLILISYAKNNFLQILQYSNFAVKFMGIVIAIPIGLIMGFATPLLSLWVGNAYGNLTPLLWIVLAPLAINLSVIPLFSINTAYNKVKIPGLVSLVLGVANLLLAILLAKTFQLELYGIALAGAIILSAKNLVFTPLYAAHILSMKKITFYKFIIFSLITEVVSFILSFSISKIIAINTFFLLGVLVLGLVLFLIGFVWILLLNQQEKDIIKFNFMKVKSHEKIS